MSADAAIENRGPLKVYTVRLALSDVEWRRVQTDAAALGITPDGLLSLVVALAARGDWLAASGLALADILQHPWRE